MSKLTAVDYRNDPTLEVSPSSLATKKLCLIMINVGQHRVAVNLYLRIYLSLEKD